MAVPKNLIRRVLIDIICLILVYSPWLALHWGKVQPFHRGFYCDDESIRHPFHESSISGTANTTLCVLVPILVILVTEAIHICAQRSSKPESVAPITVDGVQLHPLIVLSYKATTAFLLGCAAQQTVVNIMKFAVGRLRPHFIDVCRPNWTMVSCFEANTTLPRYVEDMFCTGASEKRIVEGRLSFPSGHSSMSTYSMLFTAIYLQGRLSWKGSLMLKPFLQMVLLYIACIISVSRISDYKHHWSDVLTGVLVGAVFALYGGRVVWDYFEQFNWKKMMTMRTNVEDGLKQYPPDPATAPAREHLEQSI